MPPPPHMQRIDQALSAFLMRALNRLTENVRSEESLRQALGGLGLDAGDIDVVIAYAGSIQNAVDDLNDAVSTLVEAIDAGNVNPVDLVNTGAELWSSARALVEGAPTLPLPSAPTLEGSVFEAILADAVDATIRDLNPGAWASGQALQLTGPQFSLGGTLEGLVDSPTSLIWGRISTFRRTLDITALGLRTGPPVTNVRWLPLTQDKVIEPLRTLYPAADTVLWRCAIHLAEDTWGDPISFVFEVLGDDQSPPNFVALGLSVPTLVAAFQIGEHVEVAAHPFDRPLWLGMSAFGKLDLLLDNPPGLELTSRFPASGFTFGEPGSLELALAEPVLGAQLSPGGFRAKFGFDRFELRLSPGILGEALAMLLPRDGISLRGKFVAAVDEHGPHLDGGVGLSATWPDTLRLPGVVVRDLQTTITTAADIGTEAIGTVIVTLGPLTVSIEGLGVNQVLALTPRGDGNVGLVDLRAPQLRPPTGIGVSIDASIVKGGGFLRIEGDEISGALQLELTLGSVSLTIRAIGVIGDADGAVSFLVIMSVEFTPAIELFLGLTLNGIGGVFGVNRTVNADALGELVRSGRANDVLFPDSLAARAVEIVGAARDVFPARRDQYVVGPILKLGWGRPTSFVTLTAGVVFTFPDPVAVIIVGDLRLALPADDVALIDLRAGFAGGMDFTSGDVWFDASLEGSRIGGFDVDGDLALRAGTTGFVFSAGGFHPEFQPPATLPALRRLAMSINPGPILQARAEAYFAVTSATLQFGAALFLKAKLGPISADGALSLDVLIETAPRFHFVAELNGNFHLKVGGTQLCGAHLDVLLEGPGRWHAHASATISILFLDVSGTLDLAWGEDAPPRLDPVDVPALVREAFTRDPVWAHVVPAADGGIVQVRAGAEALHPLGSLRLTQTLAPLNQSLTRFGSRPVTSPDPIDVTVTAPGVSTSPGQELFAPAQFFDLARDELLSKPSFLAYDAGTIVSGDVWSIAEERLTADIVYEESLGDGTNQATLDISMLAWAITGAAGRLNAETVLRPEARPIVVNDVRYATAHAETAEPVSAFGSDTSASMFRSADHITLADYELAVM